MRQDPRVLVNPDALENLRATGKRRGEVIAFLKDLSVTGDFRVTDPESHRAFQVSLVAGFAVTWWADLPVNETKVVDIRQIA